MTDEELKALVVQLRRYGNGNFRGMTPAKQQALEAASAIEQLMRERDAARNIALEEAAAVCDREQVIFGSNEYCIGQPFSSFGERFASGQCAIAIRALKGDKK
jgi:hypothetical protein